MYRISLLLSSLYKKLLERGRNIVPSLLSLLRMKIVINAESKSPIFLVLANICCDVVHISTSNNIDVGE
jgi:hypothetical protein